MYSVHGSMIYFQVFDFVCSCMFPSLVTPLSNNVRGSVTGKRRNQTACSLRKHVCTCGLNHLYYHIDSLYYYLCVCRATPAKLQIMSPLLMTALNKIIDLPESKEAS